MRRIAQFLCASQKVQTLTLIILTENSLNLKAEAKSFRKVQANETLKDLNISLIIGWY